MVCSQFQIDKNRPLCNTLWLLNCYPITFTSILAALSTFTNPKYLNSKTSFICLPTTLNSCTLIIYHNPFLLYFLQKSLKPTYTLLLCSSLDCFKVKLLSTHPLPRLNLPIHHLLVNHFAYSIHLYPCINSFKYT